MTLKIERVVEDGFVVFRLSGRLEVELLAEVRRLLDAEAQDLTVVFDMKDVKLVDRDAVPFLTRYQLDGIQFQNCPAYIEEWIQRQKGHK
jgi:hypothetical protein